MNFIKQISNNLQNKLSSQFVRNLGWLGMSQLIPRIIRLGVIVVLARSLTSNDYGLGAIVLMVNEFAQVFMDVGITAKIVQADEQDLEALCHSAFWLNWIVFFGLFVIQCLAAFPISWFYDSSQIVLPICISATCYLVWPIATIQYALITRENRLKIIAIHNTIHDSISYTLSAIFGLLGMGVWAFVLPSLLVSPLSIIIYYSNHSWRPRTGINTKHWNEILRFGKNILAIALLKTLRNNLDYIIIGRFLGVQALGIYFFGFNAGLGISLNIIKAINTAILPHLCAARSDWFQFKNRYLSSIKTISFIIIPLVLLQSSFAPLYVPVIFGQKWVVAIPILILICLSAIPRAFADVASQLLIAVGKPDIDLRWNVLFTTLFVGALLIGVHWQAFGAATSVLLVHLICLPMFTFWVTNYVFPRTDSGKF